MNKSLILLLALFPFALTAGPDAEPFVGNTPAYRESEDTILRMARSSANILIIGETGTGKDVLARRIHSLSARAKKPLYPVHIGAMSQTLIDSELFGHVKGAFTGADTARKGIFEMASGGTLFLDELGEIPLPTQTRILRALESREIKPLGGNELRKIDIRLISATNLNLEKAVADGKFREDLMYRVNTVTIETVPLRERLEDLPGLVTYFLKARNRANLDAEKYFTPKALEYLKAYAWPGNIRELKSVVDFASTMSSTTEITHLDLPDVISRSQTERLRTPLELPFDVAGLTLEEIMDRSCVAVVAKHGGKVAAAAAELGISEKTLRVRLKRAGADSSND